MLTYKHLLVDSEFDLPGNSEENGFRDIWTRFSPYWPLFIFLLVCCIGAGWVFLQFKAPLYEAKATVLIKDEKKGVDESKMVEGFNQLSGTKIIENEIEVINSRSMMAEVVKKLFLYAPVYQDGPWRSLSAYTTTPVRIELDDPFVIKEVKRINFHYNRQESTVIIDNDHFVLNEWVQTKFGTMRFIPNNISDSTSERPYYFSLINPKRITSDLINRLQATSSNKLSTVIDLRIQDEVPQLSEDILNTLINTYDKAAVKDKNMLADSTLAFLEDRLKYVSKELDSIEKKLQNYRSDKDAIDISSQGRLFLENVSTNDQKVSEMNMQLAVLDEVEKYVRSKDNLSEIAPSSLVVNDPLLGARLEKLYQAEMEYEKLKKNTAENNPLLVSVTNQIDRIRPGVLESISNQKKSLQAGKENLNFTNSKYNVLLQSVPQKERELIEFNRAQTLKSNLYNYLSQKREETALSHTSIIPNSRIVDRAEAGLDPVSPDRKIVYLLAVALALVLFVILIMVLDLFKNTVLYGRDIERLTSVPVIAEIPNGSRKQALVIGDGKTTFIAEQFRKLRSSLGYLSIGGRRKKILVTSAIPGEGKSFISSNLGLSLAMAGKKVILLEFDMVNPVLADKFDITCEKGMREYLSGEAEPEEVIRRTEASDNLFVLPASGLPENPSELIMNERTEKLLQYAESIFDYVIVDSAPVALRSDAYVLSRLCDATLYIVRHKQTPKKSVRLIDENNKINELKNMAIVFNGVRSKGFSKNNYGYGYNGRYGKTTRRTKTKLTRIPG